MRTIVSVLVFHSSGYVISSKLMFSLDLRFFCGLYEKYENVLNPMDCFIKIHELFISLLCFPHQNGKQTYIGNIWIIIFRNINSTLILDCPYFCSMITFTKCAIKGPCTLVPMFGKMKKWNVEICITIDSQFIVDCNIDCISHIKKIPFWEAAMVLERRAK